MVFRLLERMAQRRAIAKFSRSPIGQALHQHTQDYFGAKTVLRGFSPDQKQNVIEQFSARIVEIVQAPNPLLKLREELGGMMYAYAELQVLCLVPEERSDLHYGASPYVSGELNQHIHRCAQHHTELKELVWKEPDITTQDLIGYCNVRCATFLYFVNGFNFVRMEFKDFESTPGKDWLRPFTTSMLIYCEDTYRQKIGLPSLLPGKLDGLMHSTFMNMVAAGDKNPLFEWETHYQLVHAEAIRGLGRDSPQRDQRRNS